MYIYLLRNTVNEKTYVGKTTKTPEYLLMKNIGKVVDSVDERTNNANAITVNTFGWCLLRIDDLI